MNLIERGKTLSWETAKNKPSVAVDLIIELTGEVERLWAMEREVKEVTIPTWAGAISELQGRLTHVEEASAAEIERLKNAVDTAALQKAWFNGYRVASEAFNSIVEQLLGAAAAGAAAPRKKETQ